MLFQTDVYKKVHVCGTLLKINCTYLTFKIKHFLSLMMDAITVKHVKVLTDFAVDFNLFFFQI